MTDFVLATSLFIGERYPTHNSGQCCRAAGGTAFRTRGRVYGPAGAVWLAVAPWVLFLGAAGAAAEALPQEVGPPSERGRAVSAKRALPGLGRTACVPPRLDPDTRAVTLPPPLASEGQVTQSGSPDVLISAGTDVVVAFNEADGGLVACQQVSIEGHALRFSRDGNQTWSSRVFPLADDSFSESPFDPWAAPGNGAGEYFASFILRDREPTRLARTRIARSADGGATWAPFHAETEGGRHDVAKLDVDRTEARGGGPGTTHDGHVYLTYDDRQPVGDGSSRYQRSRLVVLSPSGPPVRRLDISTAEDFHGAEVQPVAGTTDGEVWLLGWGVPAANPGRTRLLLHRLRDARELERNGWFVEYDNVGQPLAGGGHGVNGHLAGDATIDVDRSAGPRRGAVYVLSGRNPNAAYPDRDQGDLHLTRLSGGVVQMETTIPTRAGRTQFFGMFDVDDEGWIHVAYYQNDEGRLDEGVLDATVANVYYTYSTDGGVSWEAPIRVNDPANTNEYPDPRPEGFSTLALGEYHALRAARIDGVPTAYVCWTSLSVRALLRPTLAVMCTTVHSGSGPVVPPPPESHAGHLVFREAVNLSPHLRYPQWLALSPEPAPRHLYVASRFDRNLVALKRNELGHLSIAGIAEYDGVETDIAGLNGIVLPQGGRHVYAAIEFEDAVALFDRAPSGGLTFRERLFHVEGAPAEGRGTASIAAAMDGEQIYVGRWEQPGLVVLDRDPATGNLEVRQTLREELASLGIEPWVVDIEVDDSNAYATALASNALLVFARHDHGLELLEIHRRGGPGGNPFLDGPFRVALSPDGAYVYVAVRGGDAISIFERKTSGDGRLKFVEVLQDGVGGITDMDGLTDITIAPFGRGLFATASFGSALTALTRDAVTGAAGFSSVHRNGWDGVSGMGGASGVVTTPDGANVYVAGFHDDSVAVFADTSAHSPTPPPTATRTRIATRTPTRTPTVTPTPVLSFPGDSNCDAVLDASDVDATLGAIFDRGAGCVADCDRDGRAAAADVPCVLKRITAGASPPP